MIAQAYWRARLSRPGQKLYDSLVTAIEALQKSVRFSGVGQNETTKVFDAVLEDRPDLFWLCPQFSVRTTMLLSSGEILLDWLYSAGEIAAIRAKVRQAVLATAGGTPLETEKKIVEYIVQNCVYAIDNYRNQNMASALYYGRAQCSGISRAVKYLCDRHGIECIVVSGEASGNGNRGPHAWNIVALEGKTFHLDVTTILGSNPNKSKELFLPMFNWSDAQMSPTHIWNKKEVPACPACGEAFRGARNGANTATQGAEMDYPSYTAGSKPTRQSANTRVRPVPLGPQNDAPFAGEANLPHYTNLAALRTALEEAIANKRKRICFVLTVGEGAEERQKLIANAVKMVLQKMNVAASARLEILGNVNTVIFQ